MQIVELIVDFLKNNPAAKQTQIEDHLIALLAQGQLNSHDEAYVRAESQHRR